MKLLLAWLLVPASLAFAPARSVWRNAAAPRFAAGTDTATMPDFQQLVQKLFDDGQKLFGDGRAAKTPVCQQLLQNLFGDGRVDVRAVVGACSETVQWVDMGLPEPVVGKANLQAHLEKLYPASARLVVERVADGDTIGGMTWHRSSESSPGAVGLRGTTFVELDTDGKIAFVQEGYEPICKPGELTAQLLKAVTANVPPSEEEPTYTSRSPTTARDIVDYLWREAYPGGAKPDEALKLFAEDIRYEDFNYETPFLGLPQVTAFVTEFDFPGIEFVPLKVSEGSAGCCFTWKVLIGGQEGPKGISFYEVNDAGRVCFIRDIPAPSIKPPPLGSLAGTLRPDLRVFSPHPDEAA